jgi:hypothetical protein
VVATSNLEGKSIDREYRAPGHVRWEVQGYQAAITQVFVGMGINWIGEFAPEIGRVLKRKK